MLRTSMLGAFTAAMLAGAAQAQTWYGGYNLGPDYGAMVAEMQRRSQVLGQQMRETQAEVVQRTMQNPDCWAKYQQHRAAGGGLSYAQFAYQYAATGGCTPDGMAQYRAVESQNQAREAAAAAGLRQAEAQRAAAQGQHAARYGGNQQELGNHLQGRSTWVDPRTGQHGVLQYTQPNAPSYDPRTGQHYVMDNLGRYHVRSPSGHWYQMTPAR